MYTTHLDFVAAGFNATVQKTAGFTPNFLLVGRVTFQFCWLVRLTSMTIMAIMPVNYVVRRMNAAHKSARECSDPSDEHDKRYYMTRQSNRRLSRLVKWF